MKTIHLQRTRQLALLAVTAAAFGLAACGREDDSRTAGQKLDDTVTQVEKKTDVAGDRVAEGAADLKQGVKEAATDVRDAVKDAAITVAVNAELARDKELSAMRIDVDTVNGRVALTGTAPNDTARDRATELARSVQGVADVDNRLTLKSS